MNPHLFALSNAHAGPRLGRAEIVVGDHDEPSVKVLEFVWRSEDITVWFGSRTLAVMDRLHFVAWLWEGGTYVADDLAWSVQDNTAVLSIDGHHTYAIDGDSLAFLAAQV